MICESLLRWNSLEAFLKRVIKGDKKWVMYNNIRRQKSWCHPGELSHLVAKADLHPKKTMLNVQWDWRSVLYFEVLPYGQTIDAKKYCAQLDKLKQAVAEKRPGLANRKNVIFHHDNAKSHTALVTKHKLKSFGWEVMQHPSYSPDLASSNYHLFRSLSTISMDSALRQWTISKCTYKTFLCRSRTISIKKKLSLFQNVGRRWQIKMDITFQIK